MSMNIFRKIFIFTFLVDKNWPFKMVKNALKVAIKIGSKNGPK